MSAPIIARKVHEMRAKAHTSSTKRVPSNPKYADVEPVVQTGATIKAIKPKFDTSNEIFKRIKRSQLNDILRFREQRDESIYNLRQDPRLDDTHSNYTEDTKTLSEFPLDALILDVRDPEDYAECHINGALNYPAIKLRRDQYIPELYQYKNKNGNIIVLYDNDGVSKLGIDAATSFIEKLFSNTVLLSGGLLGIAERYPEWLFGKLPPQLQLELDAMIKQNAKYSRLVTPTITHRPATTSSSLTSSSRLSSVSAMSRATSISSRPWK